MSPQYCCTPSALLQVTFVVQSGPPTQTFLLHSQPVPAAEQSVPQSSEWPQRSPTVPQYWPPAAGLQEIGVHTSIEPLHRLVSQSHPAFLHVAPQSTFPPHPSPTTPQYWSPFAVKQASGVHTSDPPLQMWSPPQAHPVLVHAVAQWTDDPHPSPMSMLQY
jgi:hypothetical protein